MIKLLKALSIVLVLGAIAAIVLVRMIRPTLSHGAVQLEARHLISKAGGSSKICEEASKVFTQFGISKMRPFVPAELTDYPTLSALGSVNKIMPGDPPYISIRATSGRIPFFIKITDPSAQVRTEAVSSSADLRDSCVSAYR